MSHSQFHSMNLFILRHAWLNLWDKHMTTGRINQVTISSGRGRTVCRATATMWQSPKVCYKIVLMRLQFKVPLSSIKNAFEPLQHFLDFNLTSLRFSRSVRKLTSKPKWRLSVTAASNLPWRTFKWFRHRDNQKLLVHFSNWTSCSYKNVQPDLAGHSVCETQEDKRVNSNDIHTKAYPEPHSYPVADWPKSTSPTRK